MSADLERLLLKQAQDWRAIALGHQARAEAALAELARLQKVEAGRFMSDAGSEPLLRSVADNPAAVEALRAKTIAVEVSKTDDGNICGGCESLSRAGSGHFACDDPRISRLLVSKDTPACIHFLQIQPRKERT